jgi:hypothetical protein
MMRGEPFSMAAWAEADAQRRMDLERHPGYRRNIGRQRTSSSIEVRKPIEQLVHDPVSYGQCGLTTVLVNAAGQRRLGWLPCGQLSCRWCGPRLVRQRIDYYLKVIDGAPVYALTIAHDDWNRVYRRLARAEADYLRFQTRTGYLVLTSRPTGQPVSDVEGWLRGAFAQVPAGGRVSASRDWQLARQEQTPSGWTIEEITDQLVEDVVQVAREFGIYQGGGILKPVDTLTWAVFCQRVGLHRPDHHRWWTAA